MAIRAGAGGERARTRGFEAAGVVAFGEPEDAETGAIALLGMRAVGEDGRDERRGLRPDGAGPADEARRPPLVVRLMRLRHVGGVGREAAPLRAAPMGGDALAGMEDFERVAVSRTSTASWTSACGTEYAWCSTAMW